MKNVRDWGEYEARKTFDLIKFYLCSSLFVTLCIVVWLCLFAFSGGRAYSDQIDTSRAVIHHTASPDVSAETIDQWHKERGWDGIGYHIVIRQDGSVEHGRALSKQGAHAKGRNGRLGIVLTGYDQFTDAQRRSLCQVLTEYKVQNIERHHQDCPGTGLVLPKLICHDRDHCVWQ